MQTPEQLVTEFCARWTDADAATLSEYFTEDAIYHNIPMEPLEGKAAIRTFLDGFLASFEGIEFQVHRQAANGAVVMNERTDVLRGAGRSTPIQVMGVFEVRDGKIAAWRDYFDMAAVTAAFSG
ncbi:limonene-1,2-epoxide hydrolase [Rhodococcus sp. D2-41]|uniref:Nuclear transport factor 2 family protein n=1 Tax=Speluncibacter jeojiensis TaxID=2710754 RepID=A0A9X4M4G7_9ACTN|nr:limonene-1,2-epoxide hydrolase family protein [Rhodococcus sp. D2-41]MDG3011366.1 limonene-1,2-epoxide hydrolase [Rhodococcus sp. D2-41]MDG3016622.1 nuclear transport factor 2 family protein [Corynebacteriales bacterium D3-21]